VHIEDLKRFPWADDATCGLLIQAVQTGQPMPVRWGDEQLAATRTRPTDAATPSGEGARTIRPRRGLPGGRAVVGGLLVAIAAVGVFATVSGAGDGPSTEYVVAATALPAGRVIGPDDLTTVALDLPPGQARAAYRDPPSLIGKLVLAPVGEGELVQASAIGQSVADGVPSVAMSLPAAAALGGDLRPGDLVDAYVTYGSDLDATTQLVAASAPVVTVSSPSDDTVGEAGHVQVRLAVADPQDRIELVNAVNAGSVTLVAVTGTSGRGHRGDAFHAQGQDGP
jgi:Flp pilus assembly protein CpaB